MSLSIRPADDGYDYIYSYLLKNITPGTQFVRAHATVPFVEGTPTNFLIDGTPGDLIEIYLNEKLYTRTNLLFNQNEIGIQLLHGRNFLRIKSNLEEFLFLVAATHYASWIRAYAKQYHTYVQARVDDTARQLNSRFSLRAVEHQIGFQELLPPTRVFRTLAGKMAVRSLINETGTTRGVNDIATAVCNSTPVVVPTVVHDEIYEPSVYTVYDKAHDMGGFEFNIWLPNIQAAIWPAFIQLVNNQNGANGIRLVSATDNRVVVDYNGVIEQHLFNLDDQNNDIINIITDLLDCYFNIILVVKEVFAERFAFCYWYYPSGTIVLNPLMPDDADPLSDDFDGWIHHPLSPHLDSGLPLDIGPNTSLYEDLESFFEPLAIPLLSGLADVQLNFPITISVIGNL